MIELLHTILLFSIGAILGLINSRPKKMTNKEKIKLKAISQKMHDTVGANLAAIKLFYSATEGYMQKASESDKKSVKQAEDLINQTSNLLREIYTQLNSL